MSAVEQVKAAVGEDDTLPVGSCPTRYLFQCVKSFDLVRHGQWVARGSGLFNECVSTVHARLKEHKTLTVIALLAKCSGFLVRVRLHNLDSSTRLHHGKAEP